MNKVSTNYMLLGVIVLLHQVLGIIWYSPLLFGRYWQSNIGVDINQLNAYIGVTPFFISILCSLLFCVVMHRLIILTETKSIEDGVKLAVLLWVGITFTTIGVHYSFLGLSNIIFVDAGKDFIAMIMAGGILATTND